MKLCVKQDVLLESLNKGAVAALSDEAQQDTSTLSLLIKSVKITADKDFVIESGTNLMAVKYSVPAKEEDGILVKEPGCVVIPAKEFVNWVKAQGNESSLKIELQKLPVPEVVSTVSDSEGDEKDKTTIKKIGVVKLSSAKKGASKTAGKWELACYDPEEVTTVNYDAKSDKQFEIRGAQLGEALSNVAFAALDKDWEKVLDSVSIQVYNKSLYFGTTDMMRCALYKIPKDEVIEIQSERALLIPKLLLEQVSKIIGKDEKVSFSYSEEAGRVFVSQPKLKMRLASTEKNLIEKFPNIKVLLEKEYSGLAELKKGCFNELLVNAAIVNSSSALLKFSKEDNSIIIKAVSEDGKYSPAVKKADNVGVSKDARVIWGVNHLIEGLKVIKSDDIVLQIPKNLKSVKVTGKDNDNFTYFCMIVENSKYNEDEKEA
jgi:DNA polymerase III sliding clamp (beta) subunit (PCNA family)